MIRIRAARPGHAVAIGRVHVETWRDTYAGLLPDKVLVPMSAEIEGGKWRRVMGRADIVLVAEHDSDGIVGFGSCGPARPPSLGYAGEVYTLYVSPGYQGRGLGRRLLGGLFAALSGAGHRSALIWVLKANPTRFFYEAMGGRQVADRTERLWGVTVEEVAYGWKRLAIPCSRR